MKEKQEVEMTSWLVESRWPAFPAQKGGECLICLEEVAEGEQMRLLPCVHGFHRECIDLWVTRPHRHCPVCHLSLC